MIKNGHFLEVNIILMNDRLDLSFRFHKFLEVNKILILIIARYKLQFS